MAMKPIYLLFTFILVSCSNFKNEEDHSEINDYSPFSQATITIQIDNLVRDTIVLQALANTIIPRSGTRSEIVNANSNGRYFLSLEIDRPANANLKINGIDYKYVIAPKDTTFINYNLQSDDQLSFKGKFQSQNQYYLKKKKHFGYTDIRKPLNSIMGSKSTYNSIKSLTDSIVNAERTFLVEYENSNQLPQWFVDYELSEIKYAGAGFKVTKPNYNSRRKLFNDSVPENYFQFLDELEINHPDAILSAYYIWFLDSYFTLDLDLNSLRGLSPFEAATKYQKHLLKRSSEELSNQIYDLYSQRNFVEMLRYFSNVSEIDSLAKVYKITDYDNLLNVAGTNLKHRKNPYNLKPGDKYPEFELNDINGNIISSKSWNNDEIGIKFWATWCRPCLVDFPEYNQLCKQNSDQTKIINICIDSEKKDWKKALEKYDVQGNSYFADNKQSDMVRAIFNINGIPHYDVMGKDQTFIGNEMRSIEELNTYMNR
jgi:peroxiredoxin